MDDTFKPFDFHRIFLGDAPLLFLLEIVFRTLIMYSYTVLLLRFLDKRGMGQLSMLELAIIISFGSAGVIQWWEPICRSCMAWWP
jgi:uncharacterized membrane protein YcaP (DUF421 family)